MAWLRRIIWSTQLKPAINETKKLYCSALLYDDMYDNMISNISISISVTKGVVLPSLKAWIYNRLNIVLKKQWNNFFDYV